MIARLLATWFGVGYIPPAPGTAASLVALPFAWLMLWKLGPYALAAASIVVFFVGVWGSDVFAKEVGDPDPQTCVIDEVAGQWLACTVAPLSPLGFAIAFLLFRAFDITKLWPVSLGEALPRGWGIMTDDMIAGAMAAVIIAVLRWQAVI
ncbi:MAG: phosphatidylglycerophosphatase A [Alphaproteobacteria bacterium]|nr:phosphatidylglycerophosphatase A [Alphaproteobacteria bacterium]